MLVLFIAAGTLSVASSAQAAMFVRFEGIDGESADQHHQNWCDVAAMSRTVTRPSAATGATRRRGSAQFSAVTLTRQLDKASPKLEEAVARGRVIPTVTIEMTATYGGARQTYYRLTLTNVRVTSYALQASGNDEAGPPTEEVGLSFEEVAVTYTQFDRRGRRLGNVEYSWRIEAGR
jgi:type VI secretion system secreted protein Hcp